MAYIGTGSSLQFLQFPEWWSVPSTVSQGLLEIPLWASAWWQGFYIRAHSLSIVPMPVGNPACIQRPFHANGVGMPPSLCGSPCLCRAWIAPLHRSSEGGMTALFPLQYPWLSVCSSRPLLVLLLCIEMQK